jgi:hypothetical protein
MIIDFGNAEAIGARYELDLQRTLEGRALRREARQAGSRIGGRTRYSWNRLLCELDFQRVVLAERLARVGLHPAILRGDETTVFSAGRCS